MTKEREALKLALEAFKQIDEAMPFPVAKLAQKVIREALAQPEQEPIGTVKELFTQAAWERLDLRGSTQVYITPPHRKPLTDEEIWKVVDQCKGGRIDFARAIEAKLKEKNNG